MNYSPITITSQSPTLEIMLTSKTSSFASHFLSFPKPPLSTTTSAAVITTRPPLLRLHVTPFRPISSVSPKSSPGTRNSFTNMSTSPSSLGQFIEHIVLFKIKPETDSSKINSMLSNLNNLVSLDTVLHISAGPILRHRSSSLVFTHMLHSRYLTKQDYAAYASHPSHVSVVADHVAPNVSDIMAVDWVTEDASGDVVPLAGSALRVTFTKLKEGVEEEGKGKVLEVIGGIKGKVGGIEQLTVGENFSPARGKGFSIGSIAVFKGVGELDALENESEVANAEKDKIRDLIDEVLVVDYVVPPSQAASL